MEGDVVELVVAVAVVDEPYAVALRKPAGVGSSKEFGELFGIRGHPRGRPALAFACISATMLVATTPSKGSVVEGNCVWKCGSGLEIWGKYDGLTWTTSWTFCCVKFGGKVTLPGAMLGAGWREAMVRLEVL